LFDHEAAGVSWQKLEHVQPDALPRQATLWKGVGTYWHQLGTALADSETSKLSPNAAANIAATIFVGAAAIAAG